MQPLLAPEASRPAAARDHSVSGAMPASVRGRSARDRRPVGAGGATKRASGACGGVYALRIVRFGSLVARATISLAAPQALTPEATTGPIRIGLADGAPAARISAPTSFVLRAGELAIEAAEALVSPETGGGEQVLALGSFADEARAREVVAAYREERPGDPVARLRRDAETGRFLPVVGAAPAAASEVRDLRQAGFPAAGIFRIPAPVGEALLVRPLGGAPIRFPAGVSLTAEPPAAGFLEWEGNPYRGSLTVFRSGEGVTVVNEIALEEYLLGVVPRELPPDLFPEIEALKAQALAARTYALTPRDAYARRGYDLCAGPACQVYGGVAAEHPLSTAAVRATAGEALYHDGRLIDALYTAACGGYTENAENVFTNPTPYLVARACLREASGTLLRGGTADAPLDVGLARIAGGLPAGWSGPELAEAASEADAARVLANVVRWFGLPRCDPGTNSAEALTLAALGRLVEEIRCREPEGTLLGPGPDGGELAREAGPAIGRLLAEGLFDPSERGLAPERPVSRREVLGVAASLMRRDGRLFRRGQIREVTARGGAVRITIQEDSAGRAGGEPKLRQLASTGGELLFREVRPTRIPGRGEPRALAAPAGELLLRAGDFVRYRPTEDPAGGEGPLRFDLLVLEDFGDALDRFSRQSSWLVPKNNADLSDAVNRVEPIGPIVALEPLELGASGRIVRLRIIGARGSLDVRGLRIRRLLGLAENLFRAEARRNDAGEVTEWWFWGRGWGHGLGLCQAGAYGMAASGAGYRDILAHYYLGAEIRSAP